MSYSFNVRAASKLAVMVLVGQKMAEAVSHQVCHARDMVPALQAAQAFVDQLADDPTKDVVVSMNGSLTGHWEGTDVTRIEGAAVSVSAGLIARPS